MPQSLKAVPQATPLSSSYQIFKDKEDFKKHYLKDKAEGSKKPLVLFQGYIYDISEYIDYHPGGIDRITPFLGKDIESVFKQVEHTSAAYRIMAQLPVVGQIKGAENITQDKLSPTLREPFEFDLSKGHWWQMMWTEWTLEDYVNYCEQPKMLINPWRNVRLFDNDALEWITGGPWFMTPVVTLPVAYWYVSQALTTFEETIFTFIAGFIFWTFFEYMLHRWVFHGERYWVPDNQYAIACHFVLNGIHHAYPQDWKRTVLPWGVLYLFLYPLMIWPMT